jgi:hypothetical protein
MEVALSLCFNYTHPCSRSRLLLLSQSPRFIYASTAATRSAPLSFQYSLRCCDPQSGIAPAQARVSQNVFPRRCCCRRSERSRSDEHFLMLSLTSVVFFGGLDECFRPLSSSTLPPFFFPAGCLVRSASLLFPSLQLAECESGQDTLYMIGSLIYS